MKTLLSFLLILSALGARADLAIYNFTGTQDITGSGVGLRVRVSGVVIIDLDNNRASRVVKFSVNGAKRFRIGDESNFAVYRAQGPTATGTLVLSGQVTNTPSGYQETQTFYSGKDTTLNIGSRLVTLPRTIKGSGYALIDNGAPLLYALSIQALVHGFSSKETIAANGRGETLDQASTRWRNALLAQGYTE